jgi:signal transduction histidine kinase
MRMRFYERLEERTRLARDLHDTLLQTIQGSTLVADLARETVHDSVRTDNSLKRLSEWLGRAIVEGRVALESLRSSAARDSDLAEDFRNCFEECTLNGDIETSLSVSGTGGEMHPIARKEVFRMGYEAIRNACAHSGGKHVRVELVYDQNLLVRVLDDGHGMDPELLRRGKSGHYGIAGMRERAARIGVKLTVSSSPQGTEVSLFVPGEVIFKSQKETRFARFLLFFLRPKTFEEA